MSSAGSVEITRGLVKTSAGYLHYRAAGSGLPMPIFPINAQSSALMIELIEAFANAGGVRPIAIDPPSHGASDHIDFQPTLPDYARWGFEVLDHLGVDKFVAFGEATGALVAAEMAGQQPDRVGAVLMVNCPFIPPGFVPPAHAQVTPEMRPSDESGFPLIRSLDFILKVDPAHMPKRPTQEWLDRLNTAQIEAGRDRWQALGALFSHDPREIFAAVKCPILAQYAEEYNLLEQTEESFKLFPPGSRKIIVEDSVMCTSWEHPDVVAANCLSFIRELGLL